MPNISTIILAAGKGTRMHSQIAKPMHKIGGYPIIAHALAQVQQFAESLADIKHQTIIVHPPKQKALMQIATDHGATAIAQTQPLGTAHALLCCRKHIQNSHTLLVLCGDTPFVSASLMHALRQAVSDKIPIAVAAFPCHKENAYGRIVTDTDGYAKKIIEVKEATPQELTISLCNGGAMALHESAWTWLENITADNPQGEYLLPHIVAMAREKSLKTAIIKGDEEEFIGVNSALDLAACEAIFQNRMRAALLAQGVRMTAPETVYFSADTEIAADVDIEPCVTFGLGVSIASGTRIRSFSYIAGAKIGACAQIGPFAHIRPETEIGAHSKIGNFVELKNAQLGEAVKASHLSYLGDSTIGEATNIGAGVITCNYDGHTKHATEIGKNAFIGANAALVAPIKIGNKARVGAGSTLTEDVADNSLTIVRCRQKPGKKIKGTKR